MIYNDTDFTKRGVEASILSIKNDINRRIGRVQLKYTEIYDAIVAESNGLVDFLNEFRAAVDTIVNECNDLQGLTDDELIEIKQRIEELKEILDSIEIPDLPKIKRPEDIFGEKPINGEEEDKPKYIGITVPSTSQPLDDSTNKDTTTFYCGTYSASVNEDNIGDADCQANYIIWSGGCSASDDIPAQALCVSGYDEATYDDNAKDGTIGCLSKYDSANTETICATGYAFSKDSDTLVCINDYHEPVGEHSCDKGFIIDYWGTRCEGSYTQDTMTREGGINCPLDYSDDGSGGTVCSGGYSDHGYATCTGKVDFTYYDPVCGQSSTESVNVANCPQEFSNGNGVDLCSQNYTNGGIACKSNYGTTPGSQTITKCKDGFGNDNVNCPSNWSYGLGKNACNLNYSDGSITCAKGYITDGVNVWCDYPDGACGSCQLGYCAPASYTPCDYCPSYSPPCSYNPDCGEGEPEPCHQEPTCQPCVDIADTCGSNYACSQNCNLAHDDCTGVCNVVRHGSDD